MKTTLEPFEAYSGCTTALPLASDASDELNRMDAAREWLRDYGVTITARFQGHGLFFDDDKQSRDIWRVTIRRGRKNTTVRFGQSISGNGTPPCIVDVLSCITKSDPGTLAEFVADHGSAPEDRLTVAEYRRLEKQWRAVRREWRGVERVLGECDLEWIEGIF